MRAPPSLERGLPRLLRDTDHIYPLAVDLAIHLVLTSHRTGSPGPDVYRAGLPPAVWAGRAKDGLCGLLRTLAAIITSQL